MPWQFPARQRIEALDQKVDALIGRLDASTTRLNRLSADLERLAAGLELAHAELDRVQQRLGDDALRREEQVKELAAVRDTIADLRDESRTAADRIADLRHGETKTADVIARQASALDDVLEREREQERSLAQFRADLLRIELQAAADLSELRTTNAALARLVYGVRGAPDRPSP